MECCTPVWHAWDSMFSHCLKWKELFSAGQTQNYRWPTLKIWSVFNSKFKKNGQNCNFINKGLCDPSFQGTLKTTQLYAEPLCCFLLGQEHSHIIGRWYALQLCISGCTCQSHADLLPVKHEDAVAESSDTDDACDRPTSPEPRPSYPVVTCWTV